SPGLQATGSSCSPTTPKTKRAPPQGSARLDSSGPLARARKDLGIMATTPRAGLAQAQRRTTYARATASYDDDFCHHLIEEIFNAIGNASMVTDANVMALRTGETLEALTTVLIATALLTPYFDTPSHLREFAETLAKRIG